MKKMFIVAFIVAAAIGACGGKKKGDTTNVNVAPGSGSDMGSGDMGSGSGSGDMGSAAGSGS